MGSNPGWSYGYVPTAGEWDAWWAKKFDDPGISPGVVSALVAGINVAGGLPTLNSGAHLSSSMVSGTATNDSAATGILGQIITSNITSGSAVPLTSGSAANITSISLTAGDWDVFGWVSTNPAGSTTTTILQAGISTTTANLDSFPTVIQGVSVGAGLALSAPVATQRISLSGTTTVYLVVNTTFAVSTCGGYGYITGRRER